MKKFLFLRLTYNVNTKKNNIVQWSLCNQQGDLTTHVHTSYLSELKSDIINQESLNFHNTTKKFSIPKNIILLLPSNICLYKELSINKEERKHLSTAVPFILEENLIDNIDDFHFNSQLSHDKKNVFVSGINHTHFNELLSSLEQQNIYVGTIISELQLIHSNNNEMTLLVDNECLFLTIPKNGIYQIEHSILPIFLQSDFLNIETQHNNSNNENKIDSVTLQYPDKTSPTDINLIKNTRLHLTNQGYTINEQPIHHSIFEQLSINYFNTTAINLRSGLYQCDKETNRQWKTKKIWFSIIAIWCTLTFTLNIVEGLYYKQNTNKLWQLNSKIYLDSFPNDKQIKTASLQNQTNINLQNRFESRLKTLKTNNFQNVDFLTLLKKISSVTLIPQQIKPLNINFNKKTNNISLEIESKNLELISHFLQHLKSTGLIAKLENASKQKYGIQARISIKGAS